MLGKTCAYEVLTEKEFFLCVLVNSISDPRKEVKQDQRTRTNPFVSRERTMPESYNMT